MEAVPLAGAAFFMAESRITCRKKGIVMMRPFAALIVFALATPAFAQGGAVAEGGRFDGAIKAGHVTIDGGPGLLLITRSTTARCKTHLVSAKDDWTIDWTTQSVAGDSTAKVLMIEMGPDMEMGLNFASTPQLRVAKLAGQHLASACRK